MSEQSCAESRRAASGLNHVTKLYKGGDTPTRNLRHTLNPAAGPRREPEMTMSADKAFIGLSVAISFGVLVTAPTARASDRYEVPWGYQVQTWCQVDPACNGWDQKIQRLREGASASSLAASPNQMRRRPHTHGHDAGDRP
jgi:hypothetical protein